MSALFGAEYFGFIASAYGVTTVCLVGLVIWIRMTQRRRKREMAQLEERGMKRASRKND